MATDRIYRSVFFSPKDFKKIRAIAKVTKRSLASMSGELLSSAIAAWERGAIDEVYGEYEQLLKK